MKLFVAGLPYDMDDAELEEFFEKFGTVVSVKVAMDRETGKSKGLPLWKWRMPRKQKKDTVVEAAVAAVIEVAVVADMGIIPVHPVTDIKRFGLNN